MTFEKEIGVCTHRPLPRKFIQWKAGRKRGCVAGVLKGSAVEKNNPPISVKSGKSSPFYPPARGGEGSRNFIR
jgi:hypothetical protein